MDAIECIHTRRSIRKFKKQAVPATMVQQILEAAMLAPSAGNEQAWQFLVITEPEILQKIPLIHPYASMVAHAPVAILICGDLRHEKFEDFWIQDCAAATQNVLLSAHALGLGGVWTGIYPVSERITAFRYILHIPEIVVPFALVPIGYPAQQPAPVTRFDPAKIHYNQW